MSDEGAEWLRQRHHLSYYKTLYHQHYFETVILRLKEKLHNVSLIINLNNSCFSSQFNFPESLHASFSRVGPLPSLTGCLPHNQNQHYNHKKISSSMPHANALCHFHIAASINPATGWTQAYNIL